LGEKEKKKDGATRQTILRMVHQLDHGAGQHCPHSDQVVFLFDVMDTLIVDPFWEAVPTFFGMSMEDLLKQKHPSTWLEFEMGKISEEEVFERFLLTRQIDQEEAKSFKQLLYDTYKWVHGMDSLLREIHEKGYQIHALSNYPVWYEIIEKRHKLSQYGLNWTFVSCKSGIRKPDPQSYLEACAKLHKRPHECVFIDDNITNVEAASRVGLLAFHFTDAKSLRNQFLLRGYL